MTVPVLLLAAADDFTSHSVSVRRVNRVPVDWESPLSS